MCERVLYEKYKGHDIRSSPCEVEVLQKWKVRIDVTFPKVNFSQTMREYLDEKQLYSTQIEAHTTGLEWGRRIIDEEIQKHVAD